MLYIRITVIIAILLLVAALHQVIAGYLTRQKVSDLVDDLAAICEILALVKDVNFHASVPLKYTDLLLLFWHAPLGVGRAVRRHQPP